MSKLSSIVKTTFTPIALCVALAFAAPAFAHKGKDGKHNEMRQILSELNLSAAQKQDIRQLMKQNREDSDLFRDDAKSSKQSMRDLVQTDQWQQSAVANIIAVQQPFLANQALQKASHKHHVWSLLTDVQQAEFAQKITERKTHRTDSKFDGNRPDKRFKHLNLSAEQYADIATIKATAKPDIQENKAKIKAFKQAERQLIQSTNFSAEAWQALWEQYQDDFAKRMLLKTKEQHDVWNVLTPEQQTKAKGKRNKKKHH